MTSRHYPKYECEAKPWPLPNHITKSVSLLAGREASAILRIALGKHTGATAAHEATYNEPFTYWDWHGVPPNDTYAREWKRQRIWEHSAGFTVNEQVLGYPTPRQRWEAFKSNVGAFPIRTRWVKRIAVANWMDLDDIRWIASHFVELVGLDLSDLGDNSNVRKEAHNNWIGLPEYCDDLYESLLSRLTWLGLPDFRHPCERFALDFVHQLLPRCMSLQILSIRQSRIEKSFENVHDYVCKLPLTITEYAPKTVTSLELRLVFPSIDRLVDTLRAQRSPIKRIGIDFGAWVQKYSRQQGTPIPKLRESTIRKAAHSAAKKMRFEIYEEAHNDALGAEEGWRLPESYFDEDDFPDSYHYGAIDARHSFEKDYYSHAGASDELIPKMETYRENLGCLVADDEEHHDDVNDYLTGIDAYSLSALLNQLHAVGTTHKDFKLFALEPEWQEKSTDPVDPLALIEDPSTEGDKQAYHGTIADFAALQPVIYSWINMTFHWRPVFDWDWFIDPSRAHVNSAYTDLVNRWNMDTRHSKLLIVDKLVAEVGKQFQVVKDAGIPIHLLIGRRDPDQSSLYWGWPHNEATWVKWLKTPLDAKLKPIAPLVSTMTVMYDLRNPLDEDRLQAIEELLPKNTTGIEKSTCPRPICPWKTVDRTCPFPKDSQWPQSLPRNTCYHYQKMANKQPVKMSTGPPPPLKLASNHTSLPPTGQYTSSLASKNDDLHVRTRNAAFIREAVGWQRFWATYASRLTSLQILNVRMPKVFDGTGSVKLAKLLDPELGWEMKGYADEAGPKQLIRLEESHKPDLTSTTLVEKAEKRWNAGTLVRRTWVKLPPNKWNGKSKAKAQEPKALTRGKGNINDLSDGEETNEIDEREKVELAKAIKRVEEATELQYALETELRAKHTPPPRPNPPFSKLQQRLKSKYGRKILCVAKHAWQARVKEYAEELQEHYHTRSDVNRAALDILISTRATLLVKFPFFKPEYVFREDGEMIKKESVGVIENERNYRREERGRREKYDKVPEAWAIEMLKVKRDAAQGLQGNDDHELFASPEATMTDNPNALPDYEDDDGQYGSPPPSPFRRHRLSETLTSQALPIVQNHGTRTATQAQGLLSIPVVEPPVVHVPTVSPRLEEILATLQTHGQSALAQPVDDEKDFYGTSEVSQSFEVEKTRVDVAQAQTTHVHVEESKSTTKVTEEVEQPQLEQLPTPGLPVVDLARKVGHSSEQKSKKRTPSASSRGSKEPAPPLTSITLLKLVAPVLHKDDTSVQAEKSTPPPKKPTLAYVVTVKPKSPPTTKSIPTTVQDSTPRAKEPTPSPVEPFKAEPTPKRKAAPKRKADETPPEQPLAKQLALPSVEKPAAKPTPTKPTTKKTAKSKQPASKPAAPTAPPAPSVSAPSNPPPQAPLSPPPTRKRVPRKRKDPVLDDAGSLIIETPAEKRYSTRSRSGTPAKTYKDPSDDEEELEKKRRGRGKGEKKKRVADEEWSGGKKEVKRKKTRKGE